MKHSGRKNILHNKKRVLRGSKMSFTSSLLVIEELAKVRTFGLWLEIVVG